MIRSDGYMSDISEYVLELCKYRNMDKPNIYLGHVEQLFLLEITEGHTSAYGIFSHLKSIGRPMSYKNVHRRIKRLKQIHLIEVDRVFKRNAVHFKLTSKGLFYILSKSISDSVDFLMKYKDSVLLRTLLYRYFETGTIKNCPVELYHLFSQYLRECCDITLKHLITSSLPTGEPIDKWIAFELEWHATSFIMKLALKYAEDVRYIVSVNTLGEFFIQFVPSIKPGSIKSILCRDIKFMKFLDHATKDVTAGYEELVELNKSCK